MFRLIVEYLFSFDGLTRIYFDRGYVQFLLF